MAPGPQNNLNHPRFLPDASQEIVPTDIDDLGQSIERHLPKTVDHRLFGFCPVFGQRVDVFEAGLVFFVEKLDQVFLYQDVEFSEKAVIFLADPPAIEEGFQHAVLQQMLDTGNTPSAALLDFTGQVLRLQPGKTGFC